jgi:hypothetical protein
VIWEKGTDAILGAEAVRAKAVSTTTVRMGRESVLPTALPVSAP